jgi:hypothetical protein
MELGEQIRRCTVQVLELPSCMQAEVLKEYDWVRFQLHRNGDRRVLEGFIQELSPDGQRFRMCRAPDGIECEWFDLSELTILKTQTLGTPV